MRGDGIFIKGGINRDGVKAPGKPRVLEKAGRALAEKQVRYQMLQLTPFAGCLDKGANRSGLDGLFTDLNMRVNGFKDPRARYKLPTKKKQQNGATFRSAASCMG